MAEQTAAIQIVKQRALSYTYLFENVRTMGMVLAPDDLKWEIEIRDRSHHWPFILHLSCFAHTTPHIPYIAQQVLAKLGIDCPILGGPENCCGALNYHFDDKRLERQTATFALNTFAKAKPTTVLSICPSCDEHFAEHKKPTMRFHHGNVSELFVEHLDKLKGLLKPLNMRCVLHVHDYSEARQRDQKNIRTVLEAIPGVELLPAKYSHGIGKDCNQFTPMASADLDAMYGEAKSLGADAVIIPYHSCYRQHCKNQLLRGVTVFHYLDILAMSLGIRYRDVFKELRMKDDLDKAVEDLRPKWERLGYTREQIRPFLEFSVYC